MNCFQLCGTFVQVCVLCVCVSSAVIASSIRIAQDAAQVLWKVLMPALLLPYITLHHLPVVQ